MALSHPSARYVLKLISFSSEETARYRTRQCSGEQKAASKEIITDPSSGLGRNKNKKGGIQPRSCPWLAVQINPKTRTTRPDDII